VLALAVGFLVTIIDSRDFPAFGDGPWWAVVTQGMVGYGDTVTPLFVSADQRELTGTTEERYAASEEQTRASLKLLLERLEAIEQRLDQRRG
jgi:hypothetical protein